MRDNILKELDELEEKVNNMTKENILEVVCEVADMWNKVISIKQYKEGE